MSASILMTGYDLAGLMLANRIVMAPMTRSRAGADCAPGDLHVTYYSQRANAGLILTEATQVSPQGTGYPGTPGIYSDAQIAGWRKVTDAVHREGGRIYLQLWHVGRISHPSVQIDGAQPVAPSAIKPDGQVMTSGGMQDFVTPRALETEEMAGIVEQFRLGAINAREAGFDGVEIHGGNGYLLDQFTRDGANHRTDSYGGSVANRIRLPLEIAEAVIGVWGGDRVGYRISPYQPYNTMSDSDPETTFVALTAGLESIGLGYLHVVEVSAPGAAAPDASASEFLAARHGLYTRIREIFPRTLIVNSGYDRARGDSIIDSGAADLVAYGKPFIANPDLPRRLYENAPLAEADPATMYGGGAGGYIDYPRLDKQ
jgi:N-ethylmaleimide reductase